MRDNNRFLVLDGIRGVAALTVVCGHALKPFENTHFFLAVDLFFIMSGFVLDRVYTARIQAGMGFVQYFKLRLIRLYPMIFIGLVFGFGVMLTSHPSNVDVWGFVRQLLMVPDIGPGSLYPLQYPYWSLFFELLWSAVIFFLAPRVGLRGLWSLAAAGACGLAVVMATVGNSNVGWTGATFGAGFVRSGLGFVLGLLVSRLYARGALSHVFLRNHLGWPAMAVALAAFCLPKVPGLGAVVFMLIVAVFPLLILTAAQSVERVRLWGVLGAVSYPLYALHAPAVVLLNRVAWKFGLQPIGFVVVGLTVVFAWLVLKLVDEPVRAWLIRRLRPRPALASGSVAA